ncbi:MAG: hypothetical protein ACRDJH_08610, partial [Thermomicrobiales bacterium]
SNTSMTSTQSKPQPTARARNGADYLLHGHSLPSDWREQLIADPHRPGEDRVRLARHGIAVWAIIGHLFALGDEVTAATIVQAAEDFGVPVTAVTTSLAYYDEHRPAIDARLASNAAAVA